jgi:hypothetical protein
LLLNRLSTRDYHKKKTASLGGQISILNNIYLSFVYICKDTPNRNTTQHLLQLFSHNRNISPNIFATCCDEVLFCYLKDCKMGIFEVYAAAAAGNKKKGRHSGGECLSIV